MNSRPSVLMVRRFEKWVLGLFALAMLFDSIGQAYQRDFWAAGIFFASFALSGVIGQGLSHNKTRSSSELSSGFMNSPQGAGQTPLSEEDLDNLVKYEMRFGWLLSATIITLCIHLNIEWWRIVISVIVVWILLFILAALLGTVSKVRENN